MHTFYSPHGFVDDMELWDVGWCVTGLTALILVHAATIGFGFFPNGEGLDGEAKIGDSVDGVTLEVCDAAGRVDKEVIRRVMLTEEGQIGTEMAINKM